MDRLEKVLRDQVFNKWWEDEGIPSIKAVKPDATQVELDKARRDAALAILDWYKESDPTVN